MPELTYLSLGWGVQSWTLAAMIALGELDPISLAIHADTGHENQGTYEHARLWTPWLAEHGVRVVTVTPENNEIIRQDWTKSSGTPSIQIPAFTLSRQGEQGQIPRQCTRYWKIIPIRRLLRSMLPPGRPRPGAIHSLQGISYDEWKRMRDSDVAYIKNVYPLVERQMTRMDCVTWLKNRNLPAPPKSACVFCPFHRKEQWRVLKRQATPDWDKALAVDQSIREQRDVLDVFIHPARLPLEQAVRIPEDQGGSQLELDLPCDAGVCFV